MKIKKIIPIILISSILISISCCNSFASEENSIIEKELTYTEGFFKDIAESDWFYSNVISAYEYALMSGNGNGTFNPSGNLTISEAVAIAVRINQKTVNKTRQIYKNESEAWYMPYINYAENTGIIAKGKFFNRYEAPVTRAEFVYLICNCVEKNELKNENPYTKTVPDMKKGDSYYVEILKAIKSGIITGKDEAGNFYPDDLITRAEASAVLSRVVNRNERKSEVREATKNWQLDKIEYYDENDVIRNYAEFNSTYSIWNGYYAGTKDAVYMYLYDEDQLNSYMTYLKDNGYTVQKTYEATSISTKYTCVKQGNQGAFRIDIFVINKYAQVWISFPMSDNYYKENFIKDEVSDKNQSLVSTPKPDWDLARSYFENDSIGNYGYINDIACDKREVFIDDQGTTKVKYTYSYYPNHFITYCEYLDKTGNLDPLTLDSNTLFLDFTYIRRDGNIHLFVDFVNNTITVDFEKTKASDL